MHRQPMKPSKTNDIPHKPASGVSSKPLNDKKEEKSWQQVRLWLIKSRVSICEIVMVDDYSCDLFSFVAVSRGGNTSKLLDRGGA